MIARVWTGRTPAEHADGFSAHLISTGVAESLATDGCRGVHVLRRSEGAHTKFVVVSFWDSRDAIHAFAGRAIERARLFPGDELFGLEPAPHAVHFDLMWAAWKQPLP